jgi:hypothetical protein
MEPVLNKTFIHLPNTTDFEIGIVVDGVETHKVVFKNNNGVVLTAVPVIAS